MRFTAKTADAQKRIEDLEKEVSRLNGELNKTNNSSSQATSGLATVAKSAVAATAVVAAVAAAFKAVVSASKECIEAYKKQEQAETRLQAVLKATGNQIGMTAGDLKGFDAVVDAFGAWTEKTLPQHSASLKHLCDILSGTAGMGYAGLFLCLELRGQGQQGFDLIGRVIQQGQETAALTLSHGSAPVIVFVYVEYCNRMVSISQ